MKQARTMSIGGATFDLFVRTGTEGGNAHGQSLCFPVGAKIRVEQIIETCGGGAANTSVGLRRLGCDSAFCGVVGSDQWGEFMLENLRKEKVDVSAATVVEGETSSSSIILSVPGGDRVVLYNAGTNLHLQDATFDREAAAKRDWIYLTHLQRIGSMIFDDLPAILGNARHPVGLTWNPGSTQVERGMRDAENAALLRHATILLLNREEALAFTKAATLEEALAVLREAGVGTVCVTDGRNGAWGADAVGAYFCPALPDTDVVDTTGAGDAFGTGVTWAVQSGFDLPTALRAGTMNATSVLTSIGAQAGLLTDTEMQKRLSSLPLEIAVLRARP